MKQIGEKDKDKWENFVIDLMVPPHLQSKIFQKLKNELFKKHRLHNHKMTYQKSRDGQLSIFFESFELTKALKKKEIEDQKWEKLLAEKKRISAEKNATIAFIQAKDCEGFAGPNGCPLLSERRKTYQNARRGRDESRANQILSGLHETNCFNTLSRGVKTILEKKGYVVKYDNRYKQWSVATSQAQRKQKTQEWLDKYLSWRDNDWVCADSPFKTKFVLSKIAKELLRDEGFVVSHCSEEGFSFEMYKR